MKWSPSVRVLADRVVNTSAGRAFLRGVLSLYQHRLLSPRAASRVRLDILRSAARGRAGRINPAPKVDKLHLGCGKRIVSGWLNVDLCSGDAQVDLACGSLPWNDEAFSVIVSQHVIEHLDLKSELIPLFRELYRVSRTGGLIWLSCPDLATACNSYGTSKGQELLDDRERRKAAGVNLGMDGIPPQHFINKIFHQGGEHMNLIDEELLAWALKRCGFVNCRRTKEAELLIEYPEFPARGDDIHSLYMTARKP
jgi:predicted SAM-dependent methyltransferase